MTAAARLATLFGVGRVPFAPGTAASAVAVLAAWPVLVLLGHAALFTLSMIVALVGVGVSSVYAMQSGRSDPSDCVIDELAGQWLACAFAPPTLYGFALAFVLFRLFDMVKPWPVSAAEKFRGGLGIVADDVVAGLMAGILVVVAEKTGLL